MSEGQFPFLFHLGK